MNQIQILSQLHILWRLGMLQHCYVFGRRIIHQEYTLYVGNKKDSV